MLTLALSACTQHRSSTGPVRLSLSPASALYDAPITIRVDGLKPHQQVSLRTAVTDERGVTWSSAADFAADSRGVVTNGQPALGGSYTGVNPMGLFETQVPPPSGSGQQVYFGLPNDWRETVNVVGDDTALASAEVTRLYPHQVGVTELDERPPKTGIYGSLFLPADTKTRKPAVVVFGGSEGGLGTISEAALLAAHGYAALALAYFAEPGLPEALQRIPLEYFASALEVLASEPGVDPRRMVLWGLSRGSEAALLVGAYYPQLVHAVVASVPSGIVNAALPDTSQPAWTHGRKPLSTGSIIPVDKVDGPIMLICGGLDRVWPSCTSTERISGELAAAHGHAPTVLDYPDAGHFVGSLLPFVPSTATTGTTASGLALQGGGTPASDAAGRADGWPKLLAFLAGVPGG